MKEAMLFSVKLQMQVSRQWQLFFFFFLELLQNVQPKWYRALFWLCIDNLCASLRFWLMYEQQCKVQKSWELVDIDWRVWLYINTLSASHITDFTTLKHLCWSQWSFRTNRSIKDKLSSDGSEWQNVHTQHHTCSVFLNKFISTMTTGITVWWSCTWSLQYDWFSVSCFWMSHYILKCDTVQFIP